MTRNTIVITKRKADKYFPGEDPTGKFVILNGNDAVTYKIGAVMEDFPTTSHLQFDFYYVNKRKRILARRANGLEIQQLREIIFC